MLSFSVLVLFLRNNFNPIPVWVFDEVDAHGRVFKADAAHGGVFLVRGGHIRHSEREMKALNESRSLDDYRAAAGAIFTACEFDSAAGFNK